MYPDGKTLWISTAFLLACGIALIAIGYMWIGVIDIVLVLLALVVYFVRSRRAQARIDAWATEWPVVPEPLAWPAVVESAARAPLSAAGLAEAARLLHALHDAGIIAPDLPEAAQLQEALADYGEPVDMTAVLFALNEAHYAHADFDADRYLANLRFHNEHIEQFADTLCAYCDDMCTLAQCDNWQIIRLECTDMPAAAGRMRVTARLLIGAQTLDMAEIFFSKYLNTAWYVHIARALVADGAPRRLAWIYDDSGIWLTGLAADTDLQCLPHAIAGWRWVDEENL